MLSVVEHVLQTGQRLLRSFDQPQVLAAVEVEVAVDEAIEVVGLRQANGVGRIPQPAVKLGADTVEVFRLRPLLALTNLGGVLAAEPRFEAIGFHFFARIVEFADAVAPAGVGGSALGFVDVGEQVALEHVRRAE